MTIDSNELLRHWTEDASFKCHNAVHAVWSDVAITPVAAETVKYKQPPPIVLGVQLIPFTPSQHQRQPPPP